MTSTGPASSKNHVLSSKREAGVAILTDRVLSSTVISASVESSKLSLNGSSLRSTPTLNPFFRRDVLVKRLLLTRQQMQQGINEHDHNENKMNSTSRKRSHPPITQLNPLLERTQDSSLNIYDVAIIDSNEMWEELSSIIPLLSYGEESSALISALLEEHASSTESLSSYGCDEIKDDAKNGAKNQNNSAKAQQIVSSLLSTLENMLKARNLLRRNERRMPSEELKNPPALKKRKTSSATAKDPQPSARKLTNNASEILPWNILLRMAIRITTYAAKQLQGSLHNTLKEDASDNTKQQSVDNAREQDTGMHPLLQVFDVVLSDLHVALRTERYYSHQTSADPSEFRTAHSSNDRMIRDWRSSINSNNERVVWGPSRYSFLKDRQLVDKLFESFSMNVDMIEWKEKVDLVIVALDEYTTMGHDTLLANGSDNKIPNGTVNRQRNPSTANIIANLSRTHVQRFEKQMEEEEKHPRCGLKKDCPDPVLSTNLLHTMGAQKGVVVDSHDEEIDEMEDAYRAAIAFSFSKETGRQGARDIIERRFGFLVQQLLVPAREQNKRNMDLNINGAESYLESLLHTLVNPSYPNVWARLVNESHGKETPTMLRKGRSLLISFLAGIRAPGWKSVFLQVDPSPVSSYLGFLSHREIPTANSTSLKHEGGMYRSSFLLPLVTNGATSLSPPPVVSELGLSLCVGNFLQKSLKEDELNFQASNKGFGVSLFRNYGPLHQVRDSNDRHDLLQLIADPLPDVQDLTRDLFDLTLRLAASGEDENHNKRFSRRLANPSASDSLNSLLQVVSDHSEWLPPHSIISRYRFILGCVVDSFKCIDVDKHLMVDYEIEFGVEQNTSSGDDPNSWTKRAASLVNATKSVRLRGRIALYATQFVVLICTKNVSPEQRTLQNSNCLSRQSHFYSCLQFRQFSRFWDNVDKTIENHSSNIMARVFDFTFCLKILLPLSYHCSKMLAATPMPLLQKACTPSHNETSQTTTLSLITILCSLLNVLAEECLLTECAHLGWAVEMLSFSVSHFVFGMDSISDGGYYLNGSSSNSMWDYVACNLRKLYCDVWGKEWRNAPTSKANGDFLFFESVENLCGGSKLTVLLPSFGTCVSSLIEFSSRSKDTEENNELSGCTSWCQFISNILFRRYKTAISIQSNEARIVGDNDSSCQKEFNLLSLWIRHLASNLQEMICSHTSIFNKGKKFGKEAEEHLAEQTRNRLMSPLLRCLHSNIMLRASSSITPTPCTRDEYLECGTASGHDIVAFVFVNLFKEESAKFLHKPSPVKTRKWGVYRKCIEKIFLLTPHCTLFSRPGHQGLSEYSADALNDIWDQYGQCNFVHCNFIMVAAGLHVNASAKCNRVHYTHQDGSSAQLKQFYELFSSRAKECIVNTFQKTKNSVGIKPMSSLDALICSVQRELSEKGAEVGLSWWKEITADIMSLMSPEQTVDQNKHGYSNGPAKDIAKAFSTLEYNLSSISHWD